MIWVGAAGGGGAGEGAWEAPPHALAVPELWGARLPESWDHTPEPSVRETGAF